LSGPGCTIPKGIDGPGKVCPVPSVPIKTFTNFEFCAKIVEQQNRNKMSNLFVIFWVCDFLRFLLNHLEAL
jgi:hypothetical protein